MTCASAAAVGIGPWFYPAICCALLQGFARPRRQPYRCGRQAKRSQALSGLQYARFAWLVQPSLDFFGRFGVIAEVTRGPMANRPAQYKAKLRVAAEDHCMLDGVKLQSCAGSLAIVINRRKSPIGCWPEVVQLLDS